MNDHDREAGQRATSTLTEVIREISADGRMTLRQIREELMGHGVFMTLDGEIMYQQDRKSLVNELDDLIDEYGFDKLAAEVLGTAG